MQLSHRLSTAASMITPGSAFADIGTDHAYVPIWLYEHQIIVSAIASDVRKGPCDRARKHILQHQLSDIIQVRMGSGLTTLKPGESDSVLIAGMGGMLMCQLMQEGAEVLQSLKEIVLQPQSDIREVRVCVQKYGFHIVKEAMVLEEGKYYPMMKAVPGTTEPYTETELCFGPLLLKEKNPVLRQFLEKERKQKKSIVCSLAGSDTPSACNRREELSRELAFMEEALLMMK